KGVAAHQHAQPQSFGPCRQRREQSPALKIRTVGPRWLLVVVADPGAVKAKLIKPLPQIHRLRPGHVLVSDNADPKWLLPPCFAHRRSGSSFGWSLETHGFGSRRP